MLVVSNAYRLCFVAVLLFTLALGATAQTITPPQLRNHTIISESLGAGDAFRWEL